MTRFLLRAILACDISTAQQPQVTVVPHEPAASTGFVGIAVWPEPDFRVIAGVLPNSPADRAGVVAGDYILAIDDHSTTEMSFESFSGYAWAPSGTHATLTLRRAHTGQTETLDLERTDAATLNPKSNDWASYVPPLIHQ
jgi:C-terminal processing protease CtpA/Prc